VPPAQLKKSFRALKSFSNGMSWAVPAAPAMRIFPMGVRTVQDIQSGQNGWDDFLVPGASTCSDGILAALGNGSGIMVPAP
jgi:hypothetical protein